MAPELVAYLLDGGGMDAHAPPFEDFSADFACEGHFYAEALCHALQDAAGRPVQDTVHGVCPRKDVMKPKKPAPPRLCAFVIALR